MRKPEKLIFVIDLSGIKCNGGVIYLFGLEAGEKTILF